MRWRCWYTSISIEWRLKFRNSRCKFCCSIQSKYFWYQLDFVLSVTTIMKTVIGAGILSLPFTMSRLGYVMATIMFILIVSVNQITCIALLKAKNLSRHSNYTSISYHIFRSRVFQALISVFILFNNLGICMIGSYYKVLLSSRFSKKQCINYCKII